MFYKDERLALFVDGANFRGASKMLGFDIDYKKLREEFKRRGRLIRIFYYVAIPVEEPDYSPIRPLLDWLQYNGFTLVTKPLREYDDGQGNCRTKGNIDVEITVDALELAPKIDHAVIFSGNGDLLPLVIGLQRLGVRVSVASSIKSQPPMVADQLRRQADSFIELADLKEVISKPPREYDEH